eukprot:SAG11_NODE_4997_length_1698_cov_0.979987_2_plen_153_part_01
MSIAKFYLDVTPVTRAQYARYLNDSGYYPTDTHNYLRNWTKTKLVKPTAVAAGAAEKGQQGQQQSRYDGDAGQEEEERWVYHYRPADAEKPVVHVSLTEARLYCAYYNKRLPHTWEWSYAAQGIDGRIYPWGTHGTSCQQPTDAKCLAKSAID